MAVDRILSVRHDCCDMQRQRRAQAHVHNVEANGSDEHQHNRLARIRKFRWKISRIVTGLCCLISIFNIGMCLLWRPSRIHRSNRISGFGPIRRLIPVSLNCIAHRKPSFGLLTIGRRDVLDLEMLTSRPSPVDVLTYL